MNAHLFYVEYSHHTPPVKAQETAKEDAERMDMAVEMYGMKGTVSSRKYSTYAHMNFILHMKFAS